MTVRVASRRDSCHGAMTFGSLFSGVGGFDLGFERVGMEPTWTVEYDKQARSVLRKHWPGIPHYEDVHDVGGGKELWSGLRQETRQGRDDHTSGADVLAPSAPTSCGDPTTRERDDGRSVELAPVDLICGGFPCQDYSVAGKRSGLAGDRGALWWEMHRIIAECRPTWVVGENVPGLLSSRGGRDFLTIIASLVELGYGCTWAVVDSRYFGVAQRRRRLFIVGHSGGVPRPEVLALSEGLYWHPAPCREAGERVAARLTRGADSAGKGGYAGRRREDDTNIVAHTLRAEGFDASEDGTGRGTPIVAVQQNSRSEVRKIGGDGAVVGAIAADPGAQQQNYIFGPTIPRRLTPTECERLQGFPDGWTDVDGMKDGPRYRMMGNAVTVNVIEWIGRRILATSCCHGATP